MFDTIAAIATGPINQPVSIIRISGAEAFKIAKQIFSGRLGSKNEIRSGYIKDGTGKIIDEVLVASFIAPNSFTGEDVVEINAHGGIINTQRILKLVLSKGARPAERGEFSRRAFLNKKMDLLKAEAIHDLIFAKTEEQAQIAIKKFDGKTSRLINKLVEETLNTITIIETNIDYPEYDDIEQITKVSILPKLQAIYTRLQEIKESSKTSRYVYEGVKVGIVGKPNAGKSSLLNAILGEEKAIVTNTPGTTRDVVEGMVQIGQILFKFSDTAGIRKPSNQIEAIGIEKSLAEIKRSDLILHVIDATQRETKNDKKIEQQSKGKPYIRIYNKADLKKVNHEVAISATSGEISPVFKKINTLFKKINLNDERIITNARQMALIDKAITNAKLAISGIKAGFEPDEVILDIRNLWKNLGSVIGSASDEDMIDQMFKNFCLGK